MSQVESGYLRGTMAPKDPTDLLVTIDAEDAFTSRTIYTGSPRRPW